MMDLLEAEDPDPVVVSRVVEKATRDCIGLFSNLSQVEDQRAWAQDQLTRFNVWVHNIGVFARGHASLDYRLRDAPNILDLMMQHVAILRANLEALYHPTNLHAETSRTDGLESHRVLANDDSDSTCSEASSVLSKSQSSLPDFESSLAVEQMITRLYKLSAAIRKSGSQYRDLRAEKYVEVEEYDNGASFDLTERFLKHFAMKVIPHRIPRRVDVEGGKHEPIAELWLQERLAITVAYRRNRFLYWKKHQGKLERSWSPTPGTRHLQPSSVGGAQTATASKPSAVTSSGKQHRSISGTEDTRHTPIDQTIFPKIAASRKSSNSSVVSFVSKIRDEIPGPPEIDSTETHFKCPLCFILCEAKEAGGKAWIKHILRDLKPYICLIKDCQSPYKLFGSFREWIDHMVEDQNASEWSCVSAAHSTPLIFSFEKLFINHLKTDHNSPLTESQLSRFAQRSKQSNSRIFNECPLCDFLPSPSSLSEWEEQDNLQKHVAVHLQSLALLSLPNRVDDGFTYASSEESSGNSFQRSSMESLFDSEQEVHESNDNRFVNQTGEIKIDLPTMVVDGLGSGADILASYLTQLRELGPDLSTKYPLPLPLELCSRCEKQILSWWFEKHTELCLLDQNAEMDVHMAHEHLTDHRRAIIQILDVLEAPHRRHLPSGQLPEPAPQAEYRGMPIGVSSMASSSSRSPSHPSGRSKDTLESTTSFERHRSRSFAIRRPISRIVELLLDLCDTAIEINTPAIKESLSHNPGEFRTQSPHSESLIAQILQWQSPQGSTLEQEQGLAALCADTEKVAKSKVDATNRHRSVIVNSETIRLKYSRLVKKCIDENTII